MIHATSLPSTEEQYNAMKSELSVIKSKNALNSRLNNLFIKLYSKSQFPFVKLPFLFFMV